MKRILIVLSLEVAVVIPCFAQAVKPAEPEQKVSSATATAVTVGQIYKAENMPDPFIPVTGGGSGDTPRIQLQQQGDQTVAPVFSIHDLVLTGIMEETKGKQALLRNPGTGLSYTLTGGKLFDQKKKPVRGVTGIIKGRQVILMTDADEDVQTLTLHEAGVR